MLLRKLAKKEGVMFARQVHRAILVLVLIGATAVAQTDNEQGQASTRPANDWPTAAGNVARTGFIAETIEPPYKLLWEVPLGGELAEYTQPVISGGKVFLAVLNNAVIALDAATGKQLWSFTAGGPFMHSAAVAGNTVFCACNDGCVYAVGMQDGKEKWKFRGQAGFWASVCCAEGKVFVGCRDGNFYAIDQVSGEGLWSYEVGAKIHQTAAYREGKLTFGAENGRAYMLEASSGKELWKTEPLPTLSFGFTWPVFEKTAVVYSPIPVSNVPLSYGFGRDARAIGWDKPNPEDVSKLPPAARDNTLISNYLNKNVDRQCVYILDAGTGRLMSAAPAFLFRAVPQPPPVIAPDGGMILAHSGWYWGESSPAFLGRVRIMEDRTLMRDFLKAGLGPGGAIIGGMPADIGCQLSGAGHMLFVSCTSSGAYDLDTGKVVELAARPGGGGLMHGIIPAEGKLFHISGGRLACQATDKGAANGR